jgi:hypothetical protein
MDRCGQICTDVLGRRRRQGQLEDCRLRARTWGGPVTTWTSAGTGRRSAERTRPVSFTVLLSALGGHKNTPASDKLPMTRSRIRDSNMLDGQPGPVLDRGGDRTHAAGCGKGRRLHLGGTGGRAVWAGGAAGLQSGCRRASHRPDRGREFPPVGSGFGTGALPRPGTAACLRPGSGQCPLGRFWVLHAAVRRPGPAFRRGSPK